MDIRTNNTINVTHVKRPHHSSGKLQLGNYNLIPKVLCPEDTDILVVVSSHINSYSRRNRIRNCWREEHMCNDNYWTMCHHNRDCDLGKLRLVFVTGRSNSLTIQRKLEIEHSRFGDIIQGTFNDTYINLVYKSVLMLDYAVNYCRSAKFIQKIDDDVTLNMNTLSHLLMQYPDTPEGYVIGYIFSGSEVRREGKWGLSKSEYNQDYFPDYLRGASNVISKNAATALLNVARKQPLIHVEDVFITGICRNKTNIKLIHSNQFCFNKGKYKCATLHHW